MTHEKIQAALLACAAKLREAGALPIRTKSDRYLSGPTAQQLAHALWMAEEAATFPVGKEQKMCRWLGWVQATIVLTGLATVDDMKRLNMPETEEFVSANTSRTICDECGNKPTITGPDGEVRKCFRCDGAGTVARGTP